ncbi:MAG: serine hydrolase [FCB group bacterium]|nr:serine hydrolase [FCB group bacterium]
MTRLRFFLLICFFSLYCSNRPPVSDTTIPQAAPKSLQQQISLETLSLREKIAQMIMVRIRGDFYTDKNWYRQQLRGWISENKIGGLITFGGSVHGSFYNIEEFQRWADVPLLVAADYERGTGQWLSGGTLFPTNMAVAAAGDPELAYQQGRITAIEAKSLGVQIAFAPVMDVNNNPENPIINFRSYSDDPETVARYGTEFIKGLQSEGLIACAKHFPGHGNTATDSHSSLPTIPGDREQLDAVELRPFKKAVEAGVGMIMVGHIAVPGLDPSGRAASQSEIITRGLLRDTWGFDGVIVTDGMEMGGLTNSAWAGESAIRAIEAGADILLLPMDVLHTINAVEEAVQTGRLSEQRIDESVNRILQLKTSLGLLSTKVNETWAEVERDVGTTEHRDLAKDIARKSITVIKDSGNLPLKPEKIKKLAHLILTMDANGRDQLSPFVSDVARTHGNVEEIFISDKLDDAVTDDILRRVSKADKVLVTLLVRIRMNKGLSTIDPSHNKLLTRLHEKNISFVTVGFGSPYLPDYDILDTYLCAYGYGAVSQRAAADALWGRIAVSGKLPVNLNEKYRRGDGVDIKKRTWGFGQADRKYDLDQARQVLNKAIEDHIFPGAQIFIAQNGNIIADEGIGNLTYEPDSPHVDKTTIYDVASLTKVLATTPVFMKMAAKRQLALDQEVRQFFPEFTGGGREVVTLRHLLTHSSGLPAYYQYFLDDRFHSKTDILTDILARDLEFTPGTDFSYSDLGIILLGAVIEKVSRRGLDELAAKWVFNPLGMNRTMYAPPKKWFPSIAPTENDTIFRHRLIRGEVHDENAWLMGGVAPHAGVFSTAEDIGKYAQMLVNGGTFLGTRYFSSRQIRQYTRRQELPPGSDRAIGWDTPSLNGKSSAGDLFSKSSFGHLGFTGTSLWVDPERKIIVVLLTNRVYPTRERGGIWSVRRAFYTEVMQTLLNE